MLSPVIVVDVEDMLDEEKTVCDEVMLLGSTEKLVVLVIVFSFR